CFARRRRHTRLVSDWSSDVCSSDLAASEGNPFQFVIAEYHLPDMDGAALAAAIKEVCAPASTIVVLLTSIGSWREVRAVAGNGEIGRASCRERGEVWGVGVVWKERR